MTDPRHFWQNLSPEQLFREPMPGLVAVEGYDRSGKPATEVVVMEKAAHYGASHVFFEAEAPNRPPVAQAFIYVTSGPLDEPSFGETHRQLWNWGGVPLLYRLAEGVVQLFRCAHKPDFKDDNGAIICRPVKTLRLAGKIAQALEQQPWWDLARLRNGTLWQDREACKLLLSDQHTAHRSLLQAVSDLREELDAKGVLRPPLRRKLLILSLLIAYLDDRKVFPAGFFADFLPRAVGFFDVLTDGPALVKLLSALESRFNGNIFTLTPEEREALRTSQQLGRFSRLIQAQTERQGQDTLWRLYSFEDLPVELISHLYQLFVKNTDSSVYTPRHLVNLMLDEALDTKRLDRLIVEQPEKEPEIILDPSCGSGVFLVEAYKRLVLHWRSRNGWAHPPIKTLKALLRRVRGIDLEEGAVELAAFSLCLALCDALKPEQIRESIRLFPALADDTLRHGCFFSVGQEFLRGVKVSVIVGNPPFESKLTTPGAERAYADYEAKHGKGALPDKQVAYLFLDEAMRSLSTGGVLCMLQQYNFLYNLQSLEFRRRFVDEWDVREILDFISVRGLFGKGDADTKVLAVVAQASRPKADRAILHATFRRSALAASGQGFDIDYYDLHWVPRELALTNDAVWRADLLGGGRVLDFVDRLKKFRTLSQYAEAMKWDFGEGFTEGAQGIARDASHIIGRKLLPSTALTAYGVDESQIVIAPDKPIEGPRSPKRFTPPVLLVREQMDMPHKLWGKFYLTYKNKIVGYAAPKSDLPALRSVAVWLGQDSVALRAYAACVSVRLFTQKATTLSAVDINSLPYPKTGSLDLSANEQVVAEDVTQWFRDFVRLGEDSDIMRNHGADSLPAFNEVFCRQISTVYARKPLRALRAETWPGIICQPFVFGNGKADWTGAETLHDRLDALLRERKGLALSVTRIARVYDGPFVFLIKPDRQRFWLRSVALRDADETLADLRAQGF